MKEKTEIEKKVEEFRGKIVAIQKSIQQIKRTGISDSILYLIIQRSSQRFVSNKYSNPLAIGDVKAIIAGIEDLENYMFPPTE